MKYPFACLALLWIGVGVRAGGAAPPPSDIYAVPSPLTGVPLDHVRVWALHGGEWQAIPFQFDRRTAAGDFDFALHATPEAAHRRLTARDELVVARADLGEEAPPGAVPPGAPNPVSAGVAGGGRVYVAAHEAPPPVSARRWVAYDRERDEVVHPTHRLGFDAQRPFVLNRVVWTADPEESDWVDTGKIRATGRLMGTLPFHRTQDDFSSRITGVIAGPVRAVVRTENRLRMVLGIQSPRSIVDRIHTPETFTMEVLIQLPFHVGWLFHDLKVRSTLDFQAGATRTITCPNHAPAEIDGRIAPGEETLSGCPMQGFTIAGPYGAIQGNLALGPGLDLQPTLYYADDGAQADPPEGQPGQYGETGVTLTGWERLGRGEYRMRLTLDFRARAGSPLSAPRFPLPFAGN